jgi:6-phosphogluconolactonase (cycloisomerase 2 family)
MNKPNGLAFIGTTVYVTQKNARCVTVHRDSDEGIKFVRTIESPCEDETFGRLGNIHASSASDHLYICDERNNVIWITDSDGQYVDDIRDVGNGTFLPFSCCELGPDLLAVSSAETLLVISLNDGSVVYREEMGELHGVEFDETNNHLYVVERSKNRILAYAVSS